MNIENLTKFYQSGEKHYDMPDFETFKVDMQDDVKLSKYINNMSNHYDVKDIEKVKIDLFGTQDNISTTSDPVAAKYSVQNLVTQADEIANNIESEELSKKDKRKKKREEKREEKEGLEEKTKIEVKLPGYKTQFYEKAVNTSGIQDGEITIPVTPGKFIVDPTYTQEIPQPSGISRIEEKTLSEDIIKGMGVGSIFQPEYFQKLQEVIYKKASETVENIPGGQDAITGLFKIKTGDFPELMGQERYQEFLLDEEGGEGLVTDRVNDWYGVKSVDASGKEHVNYFPANETFLHNIKSNAYSSYQNEKELNTQEKEKYFTDLTQSGILSVWDETKPDVFGEPIGGYEAPVELPTTTIVEPDVKIANPIYQAKEVKKLEQQLQAVESEIDVLDNDIVNLQNISNPTPQQKNQLIDLKLEKQAKEAKANELNNEANEASKQEVTALRNLVHHRS